MEKFLLSSQLKDITIGRPFSVPGYYVYLWLDCGRPFYLGVGRNRRAWNEHLEPAEGIRRNSMNFKVYIVRSFLSKKTAHALERHLFKTTKGLVNARTTKKA